MSWLTDSTSTRKVCTQYCIFMQHLLLDKLCLAFQQYHPPFISQLSAVQAGVQSCSLIYLFSYKVWIFHMHFLNLSLDRNAIFSDTSANLMYFFTFSCPKFHYETKCSLEAEIILLLVGEKIICQEPGEFHKQILELRNHFKIHFMMSAAQSDKILKAHSKTKWPNYHNPVDPEQQLAVW